MVVLAKSGHVSSGEDITLLTADAWGEWLAEQESIALKVYGIKPSQLVADQRREQGISRDYKGREILELLQNATDAAKKAEQRGRVLIELSPAGLLVANTGVGFTTGGVKSLQTADLSPKRSKNSKLIGSKGLGFRSILNWSRHPVIISGELHLAYSSRYAKELIENLANQSEAVRSELSDELSLGASPIPLLPFPIHLNSAENKCYIENSELLARCEALKSEGYDTIIAMPFDREHGFENAQKQLQQLRPEFLLFSEWVETLSVTMQDEVLLSNKTWHSKIGADEKVVLSEQDHIADTEANQCWRLYTDSGDIDQALLRDNDDPDSYHLVVAIQEDGLAEPANLYSFFPTSISLPLHALCHASLELEQNRKHLQEGEANDFVLRRLAVFVANVVEKQLAITGDQYHAIDLLAPDSLLQDYPEDILVFQESLIDAIKTKNILPTISRRLLAANQANFLPSREYNYKWLPEEVFPLTVIPRNKLDKRLFDELGVDELKGKEFIRFLRRAELSIEERASIAKGLISNRFDSAYYYQGLLLDTSGNEMSENDSIYQPGGRLSANLVFPKWANVKILNDELWELLRTKRVRESVKALSGFGVQEYSLVNLIAGLVASANRAVKNLNEYEVRTDLLISIYELFHKKDDDKARPAFPVQVSAILLNKKGDWVRAKDLYFSSSYSVDGQIVSRLFKKSPEKLVENSKFFCDRGMEYEDLFEFFKWLGVETWPRDVTSNVVDDEFLDFTFSKINFPAVFEDNNIYKTIEDMPWNSEFQTVKSLDGIDTIVSSESDAILAWLSKDVRAMTWLTNVESNGKLSFVPSGCTKARDYKGELPSYIHWKIKYSSWLNSSDGKSLAPVDCMVNDSAVAGIFPRPVAPTKGVMDLYSLNSNLLKYAWINAGVRSGIEDLDSEEIYALFLALPSKNPTGNLAKKLYNWLIKTTNFVIDDRGKNYQQFINEGVILAKKGDVLNYFPVKEAYHVDVEGFPSELLKSLPVASLLKKRGAEKVRCLFGVNVLDKVAVNEQVVHHRAAACTDEANTQFQLSKKFVEIYRHNHSAKPQLLKVFKGLQLIVCTKLTTQITFKNDTLTNQLPPWTYAIEGDQLYISCEPINDTDAFNPLLANAIGDAIASIFGLNEGTPFAQIYQCNESNRIVLLGKMLGDEVDDDLDKHLQALIDESAQQEITNIEVDMGKISTEPPKISPPFTPTEPPEKAGGAGPKPQYPLMGWNVPGSLDVEQEEHIPVPPGKIVGKRMGGTGGGGGNSGNPTNPPSPVSDGTAGESLAMLFEEEQGRFPLYIGHITGYETIACDVLSFRSAEDRNAFANEEDQSAAIIERVIEAKEKWSGGLVKLTTNEVNTAVTWKDKYFIYRFKPIDTASSEYELKVLSNPLGQLTAVASSIEISLDAAAKSEQFRIRGKNME
ncbi:MAG: hypothetical protein QM500_02130 [Methylococcales bacterium]